MAAIIHYTESHLDRDNEIKSMVISCGNGEMEFMANSGMFYPLVSALKGEHCKFLACMYMGKDTTQAEIEAHDRNIRGMYV